MQFGQCLDVALGKDFRRVEHDDLAFDLIGLCLEFRRVKICDQHHVAPDAARRRRGRPPEGLNVQGARRRPQDFTARAAALPPVRNRECFEANARDSERTELRSHPIRGTLMRRRASQTAADTICELT